MKKYTLAPPICSFLKISNGVIILSCAHSSWNKNKGPYVKEKTFKFYNQNVMIYLFLQRGYKYICTREFIWQGVFLHQKLPGKRHRTGYTTNDTEIHTGTDLSDICQIRSRQFSLFLFSDIYLARIVLIAWRYTCFIKVLDGHCYFILFVTEVERIRAVSVARIK